MATSKTIEGPTPNGGSYATIYFLDDDKNLAEEAIATQFEVVEYDALGSQVFRSYGQMGAMETTQQRSQRDEVG